MLEEAIRCPECGSPRVEYPQFTRKFLTPLLVELLISLGAGEKDYYCMDCHYTWPKTVKHEPELDVLGFPKKRGQKPNPKQP
jgi:DNA-directed RNA polymerase subunit RPC12/RpoP